MKKLYVNFMKDLRIHEFVELYFTVLSYLEKQDLDDASIISAFEAMCSHKLRLSTIHKSTASKFSIENKKLTHLRNEYLISLRLRVQSYLLSHIPAERDAAKEIQCVLHPYGREYYVATIVTQTSFAEGLKNELKESKQLRDAMSLLGINDLMNTIIDLTKKIMENFSRRIIENNEARAMKKGVREEAHNEMNIMAKTLNLMIDIHKHNKEKRAVVEKHIDYIDDIMKDFHTRLKSRNTKRKNKKAVMEAIDDDDVQNVNHSLELTDELSEELSKM